MNNQLTNKFNLLFVDDEKAILSSLKRLFLEHNFRLYTALNGEDALFIMEQHEIHAALIDLKMPGMDGLSLLKKIKKLYPDIMVIMLTGHGSIKDAVKTIKTGAKDFIEKPFVAESLVARVEQLYNIRQLKQENLTLKNEMGFLFKYEKLIGDSSKTLELKKMISKTGPLDATILIQGETGSGKELVAKAIHQHSPRSDHGFVTVDCTTISETMLESELFGHVKGAHVQTRGLIRTAHKGTLFFDEIGELPVKMQAKLLRLIQEREVRPVGSDKSIKIDVRIIAATNRDLKAEISNSNFREDLYYRLDTIKINVPPLRQRKDDIELLTNHFLQKFKTDFSLVEGFSREALAYMENYGWPGNIRELENIVRRIMALGTETLVLPGDLPENIHKRGSNRIKLLDDSLEAYEKAAIENALKKSNNNRKQTARILKIGEATLYRKIKKFWPDPS
ncbi:MAG: sigma-54 dependent transcriptional regulator [Thermodesulfobacteriota bacterium]|nr:sigma-54 dependent transcriptional regulator [Thermodesulfobacteriota bacterium]